MKRSNACSAADDALCRRAAPEWCCCLGAGYLFNFVNWKDGKNIYNVWSYQNPGKWIMPMSRLYWCSIMYYVDVPCIYNLFDHIYKFIWPYYILNQIFYLRCYVLDSNVFQCYKSSNFQLQLNDIHTRKLLIPSIKFLITKLKQNQANLIRADHSSQIHRAGRIQTHWLHRRYLTTALF